MVSLLTTLADVPLAFVDVETTGASSDFGDRVTEIGIVRYEHGLAAVEFQQLIDPRRRISPGVSALTGITQAMVDGQPRFEQVLPRVIELLQGAVVVGHNVRFDLALLAGEFRRGRRPMDQCLGDCRHVLDTVRIARRRFGRGGNGLQRLALRLGVQAATAHRALADAQTTAGVFRKLMEPIGGWAVCLCDCIAQQGGPMGLLPRAGGQRLLPLELEEAIEQRSRVVMEYVDANEMRTRRTIEPLEVRRKNGELVLIAWCRLRNDRRNFKVDRIVSLNRVEAEPEPHTAPAEAPSSAEVQPTLF